MDLGLNLQICILKALWVILLKMGLRQHLGKTGLMSRMLSSQVLFLCLGWNLEASCSHQLSSSLLNVIQSMVSPEEPDVFPVVFKIWDDAQIS